MPGFFLFRSGAFTPKIAKRDYIEKHLEDGKESKICGFIENIWANALKNAVEKKQDLFDGNKAHFYLKLTDKEDAGILKIIPTRYKNLVAAHSLENTEEIGLRKLRPGGAIVVCTTKDGKVIVGSRDATRKPGKDGDDFSAQFPCGFIDPDESFYTQFKAKDEGMVGFDALSSSIVSQGIRELNEEVLKFPKGSIAKAGLLGCIYNDVEVPSKKHPDGKKTIQSICSFVVACEVNLTFAEIQAIRNDKKYVPVDGHKEIRTIEGIDISKINIEEPEVELEGKARRFVSEHPQVFKLLAENAKEISAKTI